MPSKTKAAPPKATSVKASIAKEKDVKVKAKDEAPEKDGAETPDTPLPLLDLSDAAVKKMISTAKKRGYVTYDELNAVLPSEEVTSEQIEDIAGDAQRDGHQRRRERRGRDGEEGEKEERRRRRGRTSWSKSTHKLPAKAEAKEPTERTDDPVRMYLREMGSVELLSREGEIAIAKRIEAGREAMIAGLCESPLTFQAIIIWRDELNDRQDLPARHHRSRSDLCRPRRQGDAGAGRPRWPAAARRPAGPWPDSADRRRPPPRRRSATPFKPRAGR